MKNQIVTVLIVLFLIVGCKWFGAKGIVSNEKISIDLDAMKFKPTKGFVDWTFKEDATRCFKIVESKTEGDNTSMTLDLRATQLLGEDDVMVISGNLLVNYKKDGKGNWRMEKVESKDIEGKTIPFKEAMSKFAEIAKPVCAYYSDMPITRK